MSSLPPYTTTSVVDLNAEQVAWLLTRVAYGINEQHVQAYCEVAKAEGFMISTRKLYDDLVNVGDELVNMGDCESEFGFQWKIHPKLQSNDDPFFLRIVEREVDQSIASFVTSIDLACISLAGLEPSQTGQSVVEDILRIRPRISREICKVMQMPGSTNDDVIATLCHLDEFYSSRAVLKHKDALRSSISGVIALINVASAVLKGGDMNEVMQINYATARDACLNTPRHLAEQLAILGLSLSVLRGCFSTCNSSVGASSRAPPWYKLVDIIGEYFCYKGVTTRFIGACEVALLEMRKDMAQSDSCDMWDGTLLCSTRDIGKHVKDFSDTFDSVQAVRSPDHRGGVTGLAIVASNPGSRHALRVVRLLGTLRRCAHAGLFNPRQAKGSIILSSVARFQTENKFLLSEISNIKLKPLEDLLEEQCPPFLFEMPVSPEGHAQSAVSKGARGPTTDVTGDMHDSEVIPHVSMALQRDYNIIRVFQWLVSHGASDVLLKDIKRTMMSSGGYFEGHSERSVEQSVLFVVKKCLKLARETVLVEGVMHYERAVADGFAGAGLVRLDASGTTSLKSFLSLTLSRMESGDPVYDKEWHKSKSSRNRAGSKASRLTIMKSKRM
tara:strand:- start:4097 stop:5935 length:1839 start_codon:yes stop_codon:yes gene_type:complete